MTQHDLAARIVAELNGMIGATDAEKAQALIDAGLVLLDDCCSLVGCGRDAYSVNEDGYPLCRSCAGWRV